MSDAQSRCGFVAIVGRPNVGKSTLLNRILGRKVSIISPKPQTTRHRILGIKTAGPVQAVYVDTPGLHLGEKRAINRYLNRTAAGALEGVDVAVFVVEALRWTEEDDYVLKRLALLHLPILLAVNKVDKVKDKRLLLPCLDEAAAKGDFTHVIPLSAQTGENVDALERRVLELLPVSEPLFPGDQVTDRSERFMAAELIREKLTLRLGQELPYALTVEIERFERKVGILCIGAVIWVERPGQKAIVIGKGGAMLKDIGTRARKEMEVQFGRKVFLDLWVKVKEDWSDNEWMLRSFGYTE